MRGLIVLDFWILAYSKRSRTWGQNNDQDQQDYDLQKVSKHDLLSIYAPHAMRQLRTFTMDEGFDAGQLGSAYSKHMVEDPIRQQALKAIDTFEGNSFTISFIEKAFLI